MEFLESCRAQWSTYEEKRRVFEEWLAPAEEVIFQEKIGHTRSEVDKYAEEIKVYVSIRAA